MPVIGTVVRIHGLKVMAEKNGFWRTVRAFDVTSDFVEVEVSPTEVMQLRPASLALGAFVLTPAIARTSQRRRREELPAQDNVRQPASKELRAAPNRAAKSGAAATMAACRAFSSATASPGP